MLIVYYSYTGRTKKYIEKIKLYINCDILEIKPKVDITAKGFKSYIIGGYKSVRKQAPELQDYNCNLENYDFIIFASPIWALTYAPALRSFFEKENITNKKVSYLYTHEGNIINVDNRFRKALINNTIIQGIAINSRHDENNNFKKIKNWIDNIMKREIK